MSGLAAAITGVLVFGLGGRLVMLFSRLLHPDAVGRFTENGNRIGDFTVAGTIALVVFGGLFSGLMAGVVWVFVREWIPDRPIVIGIGAMAIGGFALIEADNRDFVILGDPRIDLVMLLALPFLFGVALYWFDHLLRRRLPPAGRSGSKFIYVLIAALGAPLLIPTFGRFFWRELCFCEVPPLWTGIFLAGAAVATLVWWIMDLRRVDSPPTVVRRLGRVSVAGAVVTSAVHLAGQIIAIV